MGIRSSTVTGLSCLVLLIGVGASPPVHASHNRFDTIRGCWMRETDGPTNAIAGRKTLCFRRRGIVWGNWIGGGSGGDFEYKWWFTRNGNLVIDEQTCTIISVTSTEILLSDRCVFYGRWRKVQGQ